MYWIGKSVIGSNIHDIEMWLFTKRSKVSENIHISIYWIVHVDISVSMATNKMAAILILKMINLSSRLQGTD